MKHEKSRRPSSHRSPTITLSKEAAHQEATSLLNNLLSLNKEIVKDEFQRLARQRSDCSSATKGGDLGNFKRGVMQHAFEEAAFDCPVGKVYPSVVETDSGYHIIYRIK